MNSRSYASGFEGIVWKLWLACKPRPRLTLSSVLPGSRARCVIGFWLFFGQRGKERVWKVGPSILRRSCEEESSVRVVAHARVSAAFKVKNLCCLMFCAYRLVPPNAIGRPALCDLRGLISRGLEPYPCRALFSPLFWIPRFESSYILLFERLKLGSARDWGLFCSFHACRKLLAFLLSCESLRDTCRLCNTGTISSFLVVLYLFPSNSLGDIWHCAPAGWS